MLLNKERPKIKMKKITIIVVIIYLIYSCKKTSKEIPVSLNQTVAISKIESNNNINLDSLSKLFNDLNSYQKNYAFKYNIEKNFPNYRERVNNLNDSIDNKHYNGLLRLLELYSKAKKYSDNETDSINKEVLSIIFTKNELSEIRQLYKSKITIDNNKSDKENIKYLVKKYRKIDFYFQKQIYFRDSLMKKFWEICPQYYKLLEKASSLEETKNDSLKNEILKLESQNSENKKFIQSIIQSDIDSLTPTYLKNISPVFEKINNRNCIYNTFTEYYADKLIFNKSKVSKKLIENNYNLFEFQEDSLVIKKKDSLKIYVYNTKERSEIESLSFGYQPDECIDEYYVFPFKSNMNDPLFSSVFRLEIEYNNYPKIDSIVQSQYPDICIDCPNGWENLKTYGKLKGYENIYFMTSSIKEIDDTDTFIRAIFLVENENNIINLWSSEFDNFGCACL